MFTTCFAANSTPMAKVRYARKRAMERFRWTKLRTLENKAFLYCIDNSQCMNNIQYDSSTQMIRKR
jgi:hypothetical protein